MEKMTISQAIFKVSEIQSELNEKRYALSSQFFGPVTVNGKKIVDESKKKNWLNISKDLINSMKKLQS